MLTENREFNEIYEQYKNLILKAAYTYSGSYSAAEDITQDTFLKLYMGYDSMKKKNISSWLFTTAKNAALKITRKSIAGRFSRLMRIGTVKRIPRKMKHR